MEWYKFGAMPGQEGNAILAGHRDWKGSFGNFRDIEKLDVGDVVTIRFDKGSKKIFNVALNNTYRLDDVPEMVMDLAGDSRVTLITCGGRFDKKFAGYQNTIVIVLKGEGQA
nr:class F sortase [Paenibacillus gorillae]